MKHVTHLKKHKRFLNPRRARHILSVPFIWGMLPVYIVADICGEIYHRVCFPLYGIEIVKRSEYILVMDRAKLQYLDPLQKLFCMYCGYINGLLRYQKEIAGRTEHYWCGIMHESVKGFKIQQDQVDQDFAKFDDEQDYKNKYTA